MPCSDRSSTSKNTPANMDKVHAEKFEPVESMIGPLQEFRFERLSSTTCIRLIKIHTELFRGGISCTLQQHEGDSSTCPAYVALSYVWGDSTARHTVYINGLVCRVHHSLWQFLDRTRTNEVSACEWFWTDLLCIDQIHHSEKNEQVSRMGDIYAKAKYVISWLGENTATMEALRTLLQMSRENGTQFPHKYAWKAPESYQIHEACERLAFEESYWKRMWIIQEVACARVCFVVCGDICLNFEDLLQKMETAMSRTTRFNLSSDRDRWMQRIRVLAEIRSGYLEGGSMSIFDLIETTSFCQATKDQDTIYGLLGLARRLDPEFDYRALEVSYDKSLEDIWWDMIFMVLDEESEVGIKSDLTDLKNMFGRLSPPRKHLELDGITRIRKTQAEMACQVSEAAYSASVEKFLGRGTRSYWKNAMEHICDHEEDLPCLQTTPGRSALAGLQFTSWQTEMEWPSELVTASDDDLPSGWFCAAHLPHHLRNTTSKHRITPFYPIGTTMDDTIYSLRCHGSDHRVTRCDFSMAMLELESMGIICLVQRKRYRVEIEVYCDCCDPNAPCDKSDLQESDIVDSDSEGPREESRWSVISHLVTRVMGTSVRAIKRIGRHVNHQAHLRTFRARSRLTWHGHPEHPEHQKSSL